MLIHGAWLSSSSWENFADYFSRARLRVSAPGVAAQERRRRGAARGTPRSSRASACRRSSTTTRRSSRELPEPPVLIGHSFGGLIVELLLDRGLGRAGVAMSPAPPKGILVLPFSSLKAASPALAHPSKRHGVVTLTLEEFNYGVRRTPLAGGRRGGVRALRRPRDRADLLRGRASRTSTCTRRPRSTSRTRTAPRS